MNTYTRFSLIALCTFSTLSFSYDSVTPSAITDPAQESLQSKLSHSVQNFLERVTGPHDTPHLFTTLSPVDMLGEMDTTVSKAREEAAKTWNISEASSQKALDQELLGVFSFVSGAALTASMPKALLPLAAITKTLPLMVGTVAAVYLLEEAKKQYRNQEASQRQ